MVLPDLPDGEVTSGVVVHGKDVRVSRNLQIVLSPELDAQIEKARGSVPRSVWARDILERWLAAQRQGAVMVPMARWEHDLLNGTVGAGPVPPQPVPEPRRYKYQVGGFQPCPHCHHHHTEGPCPEGWEPPLNVDERRWDAHDWDWAPE
jgi:hypothetical protein